MSMHPVSYPFQEKKSTSGTGCYFLKLVYQRSHLVGFSIKQSDSGFHELKTSAQIIFGGLFLIGVNSLSELQIMCTNDKHPAAASTGVLKFGKQVGPQLEFYL